MSIYVLHHIKILRYFYKIFKEIFINIIVLLQMTCGNEQLSFPSPSSYGKTNYLLYKIDAISSIAN